MISEYPDEDEERLWSVRPAAHEAYEPPSILVASLTAAGILSVLVLIYGLFLYSIF